MDCLRPIKLTGENARQNAGFFAGSFQNPFVEAFQRTLLQDIAAPTLRAFACTEPTVILEAAPSGLSTVFIPFLPSSVRGECARRSCYSVAQPTWFQVRTRSGVSRSRSSGGSPTLKSEPTSREFPTLRSDHFRQHRSATPTLRALSYTEPTIILEAALSGLSTVFIPSFPLRGECARRSSNSVAQPTRFQVRAGCRDSRRRSSGGSPARKNRNFTPGLTRDTAETTAQITGQRSRRGIQLGRSLSSGAVQWDDIEGRCRGVTHESRRDQLGDTAARA